MVVKVAAAPDTAPVAVIDPVVASVAPKVAAPTVCSVPEPEMVPATVSVWVGALLLIPTLSALPSTKSMCVLLTLSTRKSTKLSAPLLTITSETDESSVNAVRVEPPSLTLKTISSSATKFSILNTPPPPI